MGLISIFGTLGQTTLNKGAQLIDASKTSLIRNADIAFVLIWQILFFDQYPTVWSTIGLILICLCTVLVSLTKSTPTKDLPEENDKVDDSETLGTSIEMDEIIIEDDLENNNNKDINVDSLAKITVENVTEEEKI